MTTLHARPRQTHRRTNIVAIPRRLVLTNASCAKKRLTYRCGSHGCDRIYLNQHDKQPASLVSRQVTDKHQITMQSGGGAVTLDVNNCRRCILLSAAFRRNYNDDSRTHDTMRHSVIGQPSAHLSATRSPAAAAL